MSVSYVCSSCCFVIRTPISMVGHYLEHFRAVGYREILSAVLALSSLERTRTAC